MKSLQIFHIIWSAFLMACSVLVNGQTVSPEANTPYYIIHSSGNVIAENGEGGAIIQTLTGNGQQVQFISDGLGYYSIKKTDENTYITLSGNWNTVFSTDNSTDASKFAIERVSSSYITLRCKSNNKYLGTDNTSSGSSIYSDKSGTDNRHYWYISKEYQEPAKDYIRYNINPNYTYDKPFEGWGVSLCWWANMCGKWDDDKIDEIIDWLVSPEGLNYNIFRYNIGGGDDPLNRNCDLHHMANGKGIRAEMEGFKDGSNSNYDWSRDAAQRKIMLKIKEKRPDAIFEAFSNSAPYYMTYSGCSAGNVNASEDNLRPEYYEEFAHYLVDVCKQYKDEYGIEFKTLDAFNEPVTSYWGANGGQEGCHFSTSAQINFLKILHPILNASGLNTIISTADETSVAQTVIDINAYSEAGIQNLVGQWNTHTYSADNKARANVRALSTALNKPMWMSEVGMGGTGISGNLNLAQKLMNDIRYLRPDAWIDWQYVEEGNDQWCTVSGSFSAQTYTRIKNYYVHQQFSKYIKKGSKFLFVPNEQMLAALSPTQDSLVIVISNNSASSTYHNIDLSQFEDIGNEISATRTSENENNVSVSDFKLEGSAMTVTIPKYSITTLVVPVEVGTKDKELKTGVPYLIFTRSANLALKPDGNSVKIGNYISDDTTQIWTLSQSGDGYTFMNSEGKIITDDGSYFTVASPSSGSGQTMTMESVGDDYYKISSSSTGKSLDLQGESNTNGTLVGFYDYGTNAGVAHRQWLLYELPNDNTIEDKPTTQTIELSEGWNLISLAVTADNMSIENLLPHALAVKNNLSFFDAELPAHFNTLETIDAGLGYFVKNSKDETISIEGEPIDSDAFFANVSSGWNLIGCPYIESTSLEIAFGDELQNILQIKDFENFWIPNDEQSKIHSLEPGKGYCLQK